MEEQRAKPRDLTNTTNLPQSDVITLENDLHSAATRGDVEHVKSLVSQGVDVNAVDKQGDSPLHHAATQNRIEVMKYLVYQGANIDAANAAGSTPLLCAAEYDHFEMLMELISLGADVNCGCEVGFTPLHWVIVSSNVDMVKHLVEHGARVNVVSNHGLTPLSMAVLTKQAGLCQYLLDCGGWDDTTINLSFRNCRNLDIFQSLLSHLVDINVVDQVGRTPLHYAMRECFLESVELCVERGGRVDVVDKDGLTPLHLFIGNKDDPVFLASVLDVIIRINTS